MSEPISTERYFTPSLWRDNPKRNPPVGLIDGLLRDCRTDLKRKVESLGRVPVDLPTLSIEYEGGVLTARMDVMTRRKRWYE